ncbi:MAG: hypothetical protein R3314_01510 [Longimicrobiales bacterium]|nr:hypothetical protein [Longimicrobiales bacterium]
MRTFYRSLTGALMVVVLAGCGGSSGSAGSGQARTPAAESPGPALVVERFLRAANANDLQTMTQLFGTANRTIVQLDGKTRAEERMYVLASILRHRDWSIVGQQTVPGRMLDATELLVRIQKQEREAVVPFLVVRRDEGGWIIERVDIEPLTTTG